MQAAHYPCMPHLWTLTARPHAHAKTALAANIRLNWLRHKLALPTAAYLGQARCFSKVRDVLNDHRSCYANALMCSLNRYCFADAKRPPQPSLLWHAAHSSRYSFFTLATDQNQQSARAHHSRNPPTYARGRRVSRRTLSVDAGRGTTTTHRNDAVGQATLPRDGSVAQPNSTGGSGLKTDQATAEESAKDTRHNRACVRDHDGN